MKKVKVEIPGSIGNVGSGFDAVGISIKLLNEIEVKVLRKGFSIEICGEGRESLPGNKTNLIYKAIKTVYKQLNKKVPPLSIKAHNRIPLASGLGSSAAAFIGGLVVANTLLNNRLSNQQILKLAYEYEGHIDNALPALIGGITVSVVTSQSIPSNKKESEVYFVRSNMPESLHAVFVIPEFKVLTNKARKILPKKVKLEDAVFNLGRASLLVSSILTKNYKNLKVAMEDKLHQPYRQKLVPPLYKVINAAYKAGAVGAALSGAGPSVFAIAGCNCNKIGRAMKKEFKKSRIESNVLILPFDDKGCRVVFKH